MVSKKRLIILEGFFLIVAIGLISVGLINWCRAEIVPPPDVVLKFVLFESQSDYASYKAEVVFTNARGWVPDGKFWEEENSGTKTGRTWVNVPVGSYRWDVMPVRDGTYDFKKALEDLNRNNPGKGFDADSLLSFQVDNPDFLFLGTELKFGQDQNANRILDADEEQEREWMLIETAPSPGCNPADECKNATTIIIITIRNNGMGSSLQAPQSLRYPIWFINY